jgi:uncharacterized protein
MGVGVPAVGGGLGVVGLLVVLLFNVLGGGGGSGINIPALGPVDTGSGQTSGTIPANDDAAQFAAFVIHDVQDSWAEVFADSKEQYRETKLVLYTNATQTGCGTGQSGMGPFYCPADEKVYIDPTFFDELEQTLGGSKADFSKAYVIAHEVGHHVQNLLGYFERVDRERRRGKAEGNRASVRLELQADYLAGVWAHHGQKKFHFIEPGDIESALTTAQAIGDDRIQKRSRGWVSPESFTHGKAEQRVRAFREGLQTGDLSRMKRYFEARYEEL